MKRIMWLVAVMLVAFTVTPAAADFYVIAGSGRMGTAITAVPYTITSPGLYYLTNNLTSSGINNYAITVDADDVTIDLMGFCLTGPGKESGWNNCGILVANLRSNVEIRNGSIKAFGYDGIYSPENCTGIRVVGVRFRDNGYRGIDLTGSDNLVMDCAVMNVGGIGINVGSSSLVKGSQVAGNFYGIFIGAGSTAVGNTARGNSRGIVAGHGSSVTDNTASGNSSEGIYAYENCTITRNTANKNTGTGINTFAYCTITNNTTDALTSGLNCTLADNTVTP
jgi:parallel beta-helix repeat protein